MTYQNGAVANQTALLQVMAIFLAANGWTVDNSSAEGAAGGWKLTVHRGSAYYTMRASIGSEQVGTHMGVQHYESNSTETGVWIVGGVGIQQDANWYTLLGRPVNNSLHRRFLWMDFNNQAGPFTYHMFANTAGPHEFLTTVNYTGSSWTWLGFADSMNMLGDWGQGAESNVGAWFGANRGQYWTNRSPTDVSGYGARGPFHDQYLSNTPCFLIRNALDPVTPGGTGEIEGEVFGGYVDPLTGVSPWHQLSNRFSTAQSHIYGYTGRHFITTARGMGSQLIRDTPNAFNLGDILCPFNVIRQRSGFFPKTGTINWGTATTSVLARCFFGYPTFIRWIDLTNLNPGDTLLIGSDTWRVFPNHHKGQLDHNDTWNLADDFPQGGYAVRQT